MTERELLGIVVSGGVAVGPAFVPAEPVAAPDGGGPEAALAALALVSAELARTEERLVAQGLGAEAEILAANRLMAEDPSLVQEVEALAAAGLPPAEALRRATERHADGLASLDDALLAARAADVRELGRRAIRALSGVAAAVPRRPSIVVA